MMVVGGGDGEEGVPTITPFPQYSHLTAISSGFGATGAPQLGHFNGFASAGTE